MAVSSSRRVASPVFESLDLTPLAEFDCVLLRGLPGSGKSTLAQALAARHGFVHLEADGHLSVAGVYRFDPARLADAHALVTRGTVEALQAGGRVVVANTHVRLWEMAATVGAAALTGRRLVVVECTGAFGNVHAVPADTLERMRERWQALPPTLAASAFRFDGLKLAAVNPNPP